MTAHDDHYTTQRQAGFSLVEALLAISVFSIFVSAFTGALISGQQASLNGGERLRAAQLLNEGIVAVQSIRDERWTNLNVDESGLAQSDGAWSFAGEGTSETIDSFERQVRLDDVCRDSSQMIVDCPGDRLDLHSKQATVTVSWTGQYGVERQVESQTLLTNWESYRFTQTDWIGGPDQAIFADDTRYDSDDTNVDTTSVGQVGVLQGETCGTKDYSFTTASNYSFDTAAIELVAGKAQIVDSSTPLPFEVGTVLVDHQYTTVSLTQTYINPVVVAFHKRVGNSQSVSVRVRNATSSSFQVQMQPADGVSTTLAQDQVYYIVMEEGVGMIGNSKIEAHRYSTSTTVSQAGGYAADARTYSNSYSVRPLVLHQVMTDNDPSWVSTFVSLTGNQSLPPSVSGFQLALQTAETATTHGSETIGWIAIENLGSTSQAGVDFETQITTNSITGNGTSALFAFLHSYSSAPLVIGAQQKMGGANGGWLVANSVTASQVDLFIDEDTVSDSERDHGFEIGGFAAFASALSTNVADPIYSNSSPTIEPVASYQPTDGGHFVGFTEEATVEPGATITYQLSSDSGSTWQYWDGSAWVTAGSSNSNSATDINDNISSFDSSSGQLLFRALLHSAGEQQAQLDMVTVQCEQQSPYPFDTASQYTFDNSLVTVTGSTASLQPENTTLSAIADSITQNVEFDTSNGQQPDSIHIADNVYAVVYAGAGSDGFLKTFSVTSAGAIAPGTIATLEFDTSNGVSPSIAHVSGDVYAIAYTGPQNDGWIRALRISETGVITNVVSSSYEFDTSDGLNPELVRVADGIFAIAYTGPQNDGWLATVSITVTTSPTVTATILGVGTFEFDTSDGLFPDMITVGANRFAISYRGPGADGYVATVAIADTGVITPSLVSVYEFDPAEADSTSIAHVSGTVYAIAYRSLSNTGRLRTLTISTAGSITPSVISSMTFETANAHQPELLHVIDQSYLIAYRTNSTVGKMVAVDIADDGVLPTSVTDSLIYDAVLGQSPSLLLVDQDTVLIAYQGQGSDGFVSTIDLTLTTGYSTASPTITPIAGVTLSDLDQWHSFVTAETTPSGTSIGYQLSDDAGATWQYWDGSAWTGAGVTDYNSASTINDHFATFSTATQALTFKAFFISDGTATPALDTVTVGYTLTGGTGSLTAQLVSSAIDLGQVSDPEIIEWDQDVSACEPDCSITLQLRATTDNAGTPDNDAWTAWYGADGVDSTFTDANGTLIPDDVQGYQWVQYRTDLTASVDASPILEQIQIDYRR